MTIWRPSKGFALVVFTLSVLAGLTCGDGGENEFVGFRPRVGYFSDPGVYYDIYEKYFTSAVKPNDNAMSRIMVDDWRNVRPTAEFCTSYLDLFQVDNYGLKKPFEIVALDACLGWLYETGKEKDLDMASMNSATRHLAESLIKDEKLREIWTSTGFSDNSIPENLKKELNEFLKQLLKINFDNPSKGCHSLWLESYSQYVEQFYLGDCDDDENCLYYGFEKGKDDSYLRLMLESIVRCSKRCYDILQKDMVSLMHEAYNRDVAYKSRSMLSKLAAGKVARQSAAKKWSREMMRILQLASGIDSKRPVSLAQVARDLRKIKKGEKETVSRFTSALSEYAKKNVDFDDSANDHDGRVRYGKAMKKLCLSYIDKGLFLTQTGGSALYEEPDPDRKPFEFYNLIYSLIRLTNHRSLYDITKEKFQNDVLDKGWAALYLATFACQIISTTIGTFDTDSNTPSFEVSFRPKFQELILDWPITSIHRRLAQDEAATFDEDDEEAQEQAPPAGGRQASSSPSPRSISPSRIRAKAASMGLKSLVGGDEEGAREEAVSPAKPVVNSRHIVSGIGLNFRKIRMGAHRSSEASQDHEKEKEKEHQEEPTQEPEPTSQAQPELSVSPANEPEPEPAESRLPVAQPVAPAAFTPQPVSPRPAKAIPTLDDILTFKEMHGRFPSLTPEVHAMYPELPKDLGGKYPRRRGVVKNGQFIPYEEPTSSAKRSSRIQPFPAQTQTVNPYSTNPASSGGYKAPVSPYMAPPSPYNAPVGQSFAPPSPYNAPASPAREKKKIAVYNF